jgi:hypothetical protein
MRHQDEIKLQKGKIMKYTIEHTYEHTKLHVFGETKTQKIKMTNQPPPAWAIDITWETDEDKDWIQADLYMSRTEIARRNLVPNGYNGNQQFVWRSEPARYDGDDKGKWASSVPETYKNMCLVASFGGIATEIAKNNGISNTGTTWYYANSEDIDYFGEYKRPGLGVYPYATPLGCHDVNENILYNACVDAISRRNTAVLL